MRDEEMQELRVCRRSASIGAACVNSEYQNVLGREHDIL